jgi:hypothetical protein
MRNKTMIKNRPNGINWSTTAGCDLAPVDLRQPVGRLAWYEIDINWWGIRVMQFPGFARTIKLVSVAQRFLT